MHLALLLQIALGGVHGTVTSEAGAPIPGASILIPAIDRRVVTDSAGRFGITRIAAGSWDLVIEAVAFHPAHVRVEIPASRSLRLDIGLAALVVERDRPTLEVALSGSDRQAPIEMATVVLDDTPRTAVDGRVTFRDVPPGRRRLRARRLGFVTVDTTVLVGDGPISVTITMVPRPEPLVTLNVIATRHRSVEPIASPGDFSGVVTTGVTRLDRDQLQSVPATFEPDVLRALQATVGIGAANDVNAHLAVRGGPPEHTRFLLDGAPVLAPYHMFGLFGAFNPDAVDDAQILRGAIPARVGGALGSVVSLRSVRPDSFRISGGLTLLSSRAAVSGPVGGGGSWLLAGRRTNLGFGSGGILGLDIPYWFWDLQATARVEPASDQELTVSAYGSGDRFAEDLFFIDEGSAPLYSEWDNRVVSATWRHAPALGWGASLGAWHSGYRSAITLGDPVLRADSGATRGDTQVSGASAGLGRRLGAGSIRFGLDLTFERTALVGDTISGGFLTDGVERRATELAFSVEGEHHVGPVVIAPGLRVTRRNDYGRWTLEPRVALQWDVSESTRLAASVSRTAQALFALRDDRLPLLGVPLWLLPEPGRAPSSATSFEVSASTRPAEGWTVDAAVYHRRLSRLPRWRPAGTRDLAQVAFDDGTVSGLELSITRTSGRLTGWLTYTPLAATVTQPDGVSYTPLWRRSQAIDLVAQVKLARWGVLSHRVAAATGQPFWLEQGEFFGREFDPSTGTTRPRNDASFPLWSSVQATAPMYFRADLTASAHWRVGRVRVAPFAGMVNLTNRRNVSGYRGIPANVNGGIVRLPRRQLPRFPVLGIDVSIGVG